MVIYFSGTGNSRCCAEVIARELDDKLIDASGFIKNGIAAELISDKPWVFVSPVYAWALPRVFADFIRSANFDGAREAYFVLTCGSSIGAAGKGAAELCVEKGLDYMGTVPIVMPENYLAMFSVPDAERSRRLVKIALNRAAKRAADIGALKRFEEKKPGAMDKLLSGFINWGFYNYAIGDKKFRTTESCVLCGKCVEKCPLNNVSIKDGKVLWGGNCTHCMACISYCPAEAIEYGKVSVGQRRHRCEDLI